ncbi:hypothetical protein GDO81_026065 [Engystomops pustulosus]|uniref:Uncharacterized protein n=1 Tax=Engystomops pustulosus TaxID=76066 RepID=A0AAV6YS54_ENGPU|nr:hypothetical protein GDO81_026065 [Engystomops pustulosus]
MFMYSSMAVMGSVCKTTTPRASESPRSCSSVSAGLLDSGFFHMDTAGTCSSTADTELQYLALLHVIPHPPLPPRLRPDPVSAHRQARGQSPSIQQYPGHIQTRTLNEVMCVSAK